MKIPKKIQIMDTEIEVKFQKDLSSRENMTGAAEYRYHAIRLQNNVDGRYRKQSEIEQTFFHEVTHWILHKMNEDELRSNEKFVDVFSACLTQALRSGKII